MRNYDYKIRNYRPDDFDGYVRLHVESNTHAPSGGHVSKLSIAEALGHPSFHPEIELFIAEHGGRIIGCVSVFLEPGIKRALLDGLIHPLHRKKGIATELIRHALQYAEKAGSSVAQICIPQKNLAARHLVSRLNFGFIRTFLEMRMEVNSVELPRVKLDQYTIRCLRQGEADTLTRIQNRSFADSWGFNPNTRDEIEYRINLSGSSPENIFVAFLENKPVGYCWTRMVVKEEPRAAPIEGNIHMLGVDPDFRRNGIGRNVLLVGLYHLKSKGVTLVDLTTDGEDPAALALYESLGFEIHARTDWYEIALNRNLDSQIR